MLEWGCPPWGQNLLMEILGSKTFVTFPSGIWIWFGGELLSLPLGTFGRAEHQAIKLANSQRQASDSPQHHVSPFAVTEAFCAWLCNGHPGKRLHFPGSPVARLGPSMRNVQWQFPVTFLKRYLKNGFPSFSPHIPPFPSILMSGLQ